MRSRSITVARTIVTHLVSLALLAGLVAFALSLTTPQPTAAQGIVNVALSAPYRVTVGTAAVALTGSGNVHGMVIRAIAGTGETIYIGASSAVTTSTGYPMTNGETLTLEVRNATDIYAIASASSQSVSVLPFVRR
jgi:hypothetical protein